MSSPANSAPAPGITCIVVWVAVISAANDDTTLFPNPIIIVQPPLQSRYKQRELDQRLADRIFQEIADAIAIIGDRDGEHAIIDRHTDIEGALQRRIDAIRAMNKSRQAALEPVDTKVRAVTL